MGKKKQSMSWEGQTPVPFRLAYLQRKSGTRLDSTKVRWYKKEVKKALPKRPRFAEYPELMIKNA
jgi:hypothetical protein